MCGIGGIFLKDHQALELDQLLSNMKDHLRNRGPDAEGDFITEDKRVGLCHTRLSIIDISQQSNQPFVSADGRYVISYNGEIYNFTELRHELAANGFEFRTSGDVEVLAQGFQFWGRDIVNRIRGMFAFAIYDTKEKTTFCAVDPVGKKPLIYFEGQEFSAVASNIPAILSLMEARPNLNHDALAAMLLKNLRHIPNPYTAYQNIFKLRPGHSMLIEDGKISNISRYWQPKSQTNKDWLKAVGLNLEKAVSRRLVSDVPLGTFLSGGIDSSLISSLIRKNNNTKKIKAFSIGANYSDFDLSVAKNTANALGFEHDTSFYSDVCHWSSLEKLIKHNGEPIMLLPLGYILAMCEKAKEQGIKVIFTGNGADEIFYGYDGAHRIATASRFLSFLEPISFLLRLLVPRKFRAFFQKPGKRKASIYEYVAQDYWSHFIGAKKRKHLKNIVSQEMEYWGDVFPQNSYIDESNFIGLMVENAHSVTIASDLPAMAASVELRAPFLDRDMIDIALSMPAKEKLRVSNGQRMGKAILRDYAATMVSNEVLNGMKRGLGAEFSEQDLLLGDWFKKAEAIFHNPLDGDGLFSKDLIKDSWEKFKRGKISADVICKQLAIQIWLRQIN